jgi:hypothetical protein
LMPLATASSKLFGEDAMISVTFATDMVALRCAPGIPGTAAVTQAQV